MRHSATRTCFHSRWRKSINQSINQNTFL